MNILFISNVYPNPIESSNGVFNHRLVQALALEHNVQVISPISWLKEWRAGWQHRGRLPSFPRSVVLDNIPTQYPRYYYPPKVLRRYYGWFYWCSVRDSVRRLARLHSPQVVAGFWAHPDGEAVVRAAQEMAVPSAVIVGGSDVLLITKTPSRRRCVRRVLDSADVVIAVSSDLRKHIVALGIPAEKVQVWSRGIDSSLFSPGNEVDARHRLGITAPYPVLVWVGHLVPVKGLDILLESCSILLSGGINFHLYLVGGGPLRDNLIAESKARGLSSHVTFVGPKLHDELPDWYRAADLTVLPSRSEGLPNVLRESLACGTPFVASNVGGISEIADPDWSLLVPPEDPNVLASAIAQALERWSGRSARILTQFDNWDESANALIRILTPYVSSRSCSSAVASVPCDGRDGG